MSTITRTLLILGCLALLAAPTHARDYRDALIAVRQGQLPFDALSHWQDHPLYPHLATHWVEHNLASTDADWFHRLLRRDDTQAAAWETRSLWLEELARREQWVDYLAFSSDTDTVPDPCHRLTAMEATGQTVPGEAVRALWLTGQSLPEHCDPFLERLREAADFDALVWQRQLLAFKQRNGGLVRYLSGLYRSPEMAARGERLLAVYQDPGHLLSAPYNPDEDWQRSLGLAAVDRMAYLKPESASNLWVQLIQSTPHLDGSEIQQLSAYLGIAMAKLALPQADYWLGIADPARRDSEIQHWRLQSALADNDWRRVVHLYQALDASLAREDKWQYWRAIAERRVGDPREAETRLAVLAGERSYYGFLSAQELDRVVALNADESEPPPATDRAPLQALPGLQRARALFEAGDIKRAQLEWNLTLRDIPRERMIEAAHLANSWDWHHKASQSAAWSGRYGELTLRYPTPWPEAVLALEREHQVPRYWIYGVIRQESHYMTDARSPVGALGLMQLMPYTARHIAEEQGLPYREDWDLTDPPLNLELGTRYLGMMMARYGDPVLATAAYNAGPSRVDTWMHRYPLDRRIWIESIPFEETRGYVKAVLTYSQIYAARDNNDWTLAQWLDAAQLALSEE